MSHKFIQSIIIGVCCMFLLGACSSPSSEPRERLSFNDGWCFSLIDDSLAAQVDFADSGWRKLNLPHDWAIEGDFSQDNSSGTGGGALPGGIDGIGRRLFQRTEIKENIFVSSLMEFT